MHELPSGPAFMIPMRVKFVQLQLNQKLLVLLLIAQTNEYSIAPLILAVLATS